MADDRIVGPLDMAAALRHDGTFRASAAHTLHVLEGVAGIILSGSEQRHTSMTSDVARPAPMPAGRDEEVFRA